MRTERRVSQLLMPLLGIVLVAINLRPAITSVGPVLPMVGGDLSLSASQLGLLGALPVATFAAVSAVVHAFVDRFGVERITAVAMLALTGATVLRSWPGPDANLWIGTVLIGAAIAVGNVTVPVLVKRSFPNHTALVTSTYVAVMSVFAGLAAALAVPLANSSDLGWRLSLGVWAVITLVASVFWTIQGIRTRVISGGTSTPLTQRHPVRVWRSPLAWHISVYMGVQSSMFYIAITWLPTVEQTLGISAAATGWHMFILQIAGVGGNLLAPWLMQKGPDQRLAAIAPGVLCILAVTGLYLMPQAVVVWVSVLGIGTGSSFVVALSLIASRATDITAAGQLSAMAQAMGYAIASIILYVAGVVEGVESLGVLAVLAISAIGVIGSGWLVGRRRLLGQPSAAS